MCPECGNDTFYIDKNLMGGRDFVVCIKCDNTLGWDEITPNLKIIE